MGQAQPPVSKETQQLNKSVSAIGANDGTATFRFDSPATGYVFTGTLTCLGAPTTAIFLAKIGATPWGDWAGNSVAGPVQAYPMEQLVITATGLTPGTTYDMEWTGSSDQEGSVQPIYPDANASALTAAIQGVIGQEAVSITNVSEALNTTPYSLTFTAAGNFLGFRCYLMNAALVQGEAVQVKLASNSNSFESYTATVEVPGSGTAPGNVPLVVPIPLGAQAGDSLTFTVTGVTTPQTTQIALVGLGAPTTIATAPGQPITDAPVGGLQQASHVFAGAGSFALLGVPPAGMAYRLHRLLSNAAVAVDASGTTSSFLYGASLNGVPDNLLGQLAAEGVTVSVSAAATVYLSYDLVDIPVIL